MLVGMELSIDYKAREVAVSGVSAPTNVYQWCAGEQSLLGTLSADGRLPLGIEDRRCFVQAVSESCELSAPLSYRIIDPELCTHHQILEAVKQCVIDLELPAIEPEACCVVKLPYRPDLELDLPDHRNYGFFVFPNSETYRRGPIGKQLITFPAQVMFIRKTGQQITKGLPELLCIRELLMRSLGGGCPLPGVPGVYEIDFQPGPIVLPDRWLKSYDVSSVTLNVQTEKPCLVKV